jgi:hypothetical protein
VACINALLGEFPYDTEENILITLTNVWLNRWMFINNPIMATGMWFPFGTEQKFWTMQGLSECTAVLLVVCITESICL